MSEEFVNKAINNESQVLQMLSITSPSKEIHYRNTYGWTFLHKAAVDGYEKVCVLLLNQGTPVDCIDKYNRTPLHIAAWGGHLNICLLLINHKAQIDGCDSNYRTPLHEAALRGHDQVCSLLLRHGASVNCIDSNYITPLHVTAMNSHKYQQYAAIVGCDDNDNTTPLNKIPTHNHEIVCTLLLENGAQVDYGDTTNRTSLHMATIFGNEKMCSLLLQHNSVVDRVDSSKKSPLCYAALHGYIGISLLLLNYGASLRILDCQLKTPLTLIFDSNYRERYYWHAAVIVVEWVRRQSNEFLLTGQQLVDACQAEVNLTIHRLFQDERKRIMEWVGMLECSKVNITSGMFQVCPLPFKEMVVAWLKTVSAEWGSEVDGARVRVSAWVGHLPVELVERVVASMVIEYVKVMMREDELKRRRGCV